MKCPICGESMEKGFLVSAKKIYWNNHVPKMWCTGSEEIHNSGGHWRCPNRSAYRCIRCELIKLID